MILKKGNRGNEVKALQKALHLSPEDGIFGKQTEDAVKEFQRKNGLLSDGVRPGLSYFKMILSLRKGISTPISRHQGTDLSSTLRYTIRLVVRQRKETHSTPETYS